MNTFKENKRNENSLNVVIKEVVISNCKDHLGHVFFEGSNEITAERYCINYLRLNFLHTRNEKN